MIIRPWIEQIIDRENLIGCEIGVGIGRHAKHILENLDIERLYLIDVWRAFPEYLDDRNKKGIDYKDCRDNLQDYLDRIVFINEMSDTAHEHLEDESLDFIYVDANHEKEYVKRDILSYWPKLKRGGLMAGHDYLEKWKGVMEAVDEIFGDDVIISPTREHEMGWKYNAEWWVFK